MALSALPVAIISAGEKPIGRCILGRGVDLAKRNRRHGRRSFTRLRAFERLQSAALSALFTTRRDAVGAESYDEVIAVCDRNKFAAIILACRSDSKAYP
jgi:hypothetical protein